VGEDYGVFSDPETISGPQLSNFLTNDMSEDKLWKAFSEFIRLRDSDANGYAKCFTCSYHAPYKEMDCGHGIGRQHKATKYDERNNHAQCKRCNGFEGGQQAIYKEEVEKKYGAGTWDSIVLKSRQTCKRGKFEIEQMTKYYREEAKKLKELKGL